MRRGGCVILQVSVLLQGDAWPDLSLAALGGWVRLQAAHELTGEPIGDRQTERLGVTSDALTELETANLVSRTDAGYLPEGMPDPDRKPSDDPEATRARKALERERKKQRENQVSSDQVRSGVTPSRVTGRDTETPPRKDADDLAAEAYASTICSRCHQPGDKSNPVVLRENGPRHLFDPCPAVGATA
jgi:hypothetical protein